MHGDDPFDSAMVVQRSFALRTVLSLLGRLKERADPLHSGHLPHGLIGPKSNINRQTPSIDFPNNHSAMSSFSPCFVAGSFRVADRGSEVRQLHLLTAWIEGAMCGFGMTIRSLEELLGYLGRVRETYRY